jgi:hypothetical protein
MIAGKRGYLIFGSLRMNMNLFMLTVLKTKWHIQFFFKFIFLVIFSLEKIGSHLIFVIRAYMAVTETFKPVAYLNSSHVFTCSSDSCIEDCEILRVEGWIDYFFDDRCIISYTNVLTYPGTCFQTFELILYMIFKNRNQYSLIIHNISSCLHSV